MYNKADVLDAIWQSPDRATGLHFEHVGNHWQSRQRLDGTESSRLDKTILRRRNSDGQIFVNYNGGSFPAGQDIWQYLHYRYNTNDFAEVIERAAEAYGIQPDYSQRNEEQHRRMQQRRSDSDIMGRIAQTLAAALNEDTEDAKATQAYIARRGLKPSKRIAAFSSNLLNRIKQDLKAQGCTTADDMLQRYFTKAVFFNPDKYRFCLPYTNGSGKVMGFYMRRTCADNEAYYTDKNGEQKELPKHTYSKDMAKGGYCESLERGEEVYLVEGMIDAESMKQAGFTNVLALGGMTPTDNNEDAAKSMVKTLQRFGVKHLVYVPDLEYKEDGTEKTDATNRTITALRPHITGKLDGNGFISLRIVHLPNPTKAAKQDANSVIAEQGAAAMDIAIENAAHWYEWQLLNIVRQHRHNAEEMAAAAVDVYNSISNPITQQLLRNDIAKAQDGSAFGILREAGVTAAALTMIDKQGSHSTWRSGITEVVNELQAAIERKATKETIGNLLNKAQDIQHHSARTGFSAQINATRAQLHTMVTQKPDYLQTDWNLWGYNSKAQKYYVSRRIGFAPANVSIIAAPTSHGKTLFMLQTALHLAQKTCKHYMFISLENDAEQLYIRALTAYIGDKWDTANVGNPRKELRDYIKQNDMPLDLFPEQTKGLNIGSEMAAYWRNIAPFLHFVRAGSACDELCSNIAAQVEEWQSNGEQVGGIFIDYVQLLRQPSGKSYSRTDELKAICDNLNDLAKNTGLPIIVGSQMNRDATKNNGDKLDGVELANLGESSGIENIAEDCYLIWNTNKVKAQDYCDKSGNNFNIGAGKVRSRRIFTPQHIDMPFTYTPTAQDLRTHCLYVECLKGREHETGSYCLLPVSFSTGAIPTEENSAQH